LERYVRMRSVMAIAWLVTVSYVRLGVMGDVFLPVDVDVEATTEVMSDGIDHDVEDDGCKDPVSTD
jgi:hypothetical protein